MKIDEALLARVKKATNYANMAENVTIAGLEPLDLDDGDDQALAVLIPVGHPDVYAVTECKFKGNGAFAFDGGSIVVCSSEEKAQDVVDKYREDAWASSMAAHMTRNLMDSRTA